MKSTHLTVVAVSAVLMALPGFSRELLEEFLSARLAENPVRYERAAKSMVEEAAEGKPLHQFLLAAVSDEADFPASARLPADVVEAYLKTNGRKILAIANDQDDALARYIFALGSNNISLLRRAAEGGNVYALTEYATRMIEDAKKMPGRPGKARAADRMKKAFRFFSRAAEKNDPSGFFNRGVCRLNGYGCKPSPQEAFEDFTRAAEMNHPGARNALGEMYRDGVAVERNLATAEAYFADSARVGNVYGCYNYAMFILSSDTAGTNTAKAVTLLEKAAKARYPKAMDEYAKCLYNSLTIDFSVTNNVTGEKLESMRSQLHTERTNACHQAIAWWYNAAAELSHTPSMVNLAKAFLEGKGVEKNELAAVSWLEKAAGLDSPEAMLMLAECHERGLGNFSPSRYNANWWRTKARAVKGDRNAMVWLGSNKLK